MIYELRIYHAIPGRLPALIERFRNRTLRVWDKHGIHPIGFWTTLVGESDQQLIYILAWENLIDRERRWSAFMADPEWARIVAETEKAGPIIQNIANQLLVATDFSLAK